MNPLKQLLDAVNILKGADPKIIESLSADASLAKASEALGKMEAESLQGHEMVHDQWTAGYTDKAATAEEIKVGPAEAASGAGAEKMVRDYSNPAAQHGITLAAEKLSRMLMPMASSMKALVDAQRVTQASLETLTKALIVKAKKSEGSESDEDDEDEESESVEINAAKKSKELFAKARKLLKAAKAKKAEADDADDDEAEKACKSEAKRLRKSAERTLSKARTFAYMGGNEAAETRKSLLDFIAKSDVNITQEEDDEDDDDKEDDEADKAKKAASPDAAAAAKAKTNDKGNQADHADKDGNQAAEAAKAEAIGARLEKALGAVQNSDEIQLLRADVRQMMEVIAGKSKFSDQVPAIAKAIVTDPNALSTRIAELRDTDQISDTDEIAANDIMRMLKNRSDYPEAKIADRLASASQTVRDIFRPLAAAA